MKLTFFPRALALSAILALCACTGPVKQPDTPKVTKRTDISFIKQSFDELPTADNGAWEAALSAFRLSCGPLGSDPKWETVCTAALTTDSVGAQRFFLSNFTPWQINVIRTDNTRNTEVTDVGLMTGYYEPLLYGSRIKQSPYIYPIYGVPDDLIIVDLASIHPELKGMRLRGKLDGRRLVPYDDRATIQKRRDLDRWAIAWVSDPIAAFFLQIQGSGRILLPDGTYMRVGFADQNGHRYHSIGNWLIQKGYLKAHELSMQRITEWAKKNPSRVDEALAQNPSYVFFAERSGSPELGPAGAQGVPLTPQASVAVDLSVWKLGTPFLVSAKQDRPSLRIIRPVIAQDTGGAIRGPIRFDYFWGFGHDAGEAAGRQKSRTQAWILVPNGLTPDDIRR